MANKEADITKWQDIQMRAEQTMENVGLIAMVALDLPMTYFGSKNVIVKFEMRNWEPELWKLQGNDE